MNILIVDDNSVARRQLFWALRGTYQTHEASSRAEALEVQPAIRPDVILMEILEEADQDEKRGLEAVRQLLALPEPPSILIITRVAREEVAAGLLALGVEDVLHKPFDPRELEVILRGLARQRHLRALARQQAQHELQTPPPRGERRAKPPQLGIIGVDARIKQLQEQVRRIAATPVSVLITGETGTGKEIFANAIHALSDRASERFVPLNCAVLSDNLVEDELFGHEKGAFTGAVERRKGKFEYAHKGTLFLDEIGDMSTPLQSKLLRVLQERTFERLGGNQAIETDFRLISATHRDLKTMSGEGSFREDLMFRIDVVSLHLPPLRDRMGDVLLLANQFLLEFAQIFQRGEGMRFSAEVRQFLVDYPWPGNVRELRHFVERAVALSESMTIGPDILPETFPVQVRGEPYVAGKGNFDSMVKRYKRQLVMEALESTGNNKQRTAQLLGISRSYLFKLIKQLSVPA